MFNVPVTLSFAVRRLESRRTHWSSTDSDGIPRASAVTYDATSADRRAQQLHEAGATRVRRLLVAPGQLPDIETSPDRPGRARHRSPG